MKRDVPKVAVIGSCISRDPFSRKFYPNYKERAGLVSEAYQVALPSLLRRKQVATCPQVNILPHYTTHLQGEYGAKTLELIIGSHPDVIVIDFYADVHFGVTTVDGQLVTRNHMAFTSHEATNEFFQDEGLTWPQRGRFGESSGYDGLMRSAIEQFVEQTSRQLPNAVLVLNSARFALSYSGYQSGGGGSFAGPERLSAKNERWAGVDDMFKAESGCRQIVYPQQLFVGSASHPWGLNPVHYEPAYYKFFWDELARLVGI